MAITITEHTSATTFTSISALADPDALVPNKMWQRHPGRNNGPIRIKGTYTGSPTIHAQIINAGDSSVVQVQDGTTFTAYIDGTRIATSTCAADYSGVTNIQAFRSTTGGGGADDSYWASLRFTQVARYSGASHTVPTLPLATS